jgi:hypothetical protein
MCKKKKKKKKKTTWIGIERCWAMWRIINDVGAVVA